MLIYIFLPIDKNQASGGGNQFLLSLREEFRRKNMYSENYKEANIILFNSHHYLEKINLVKGKKIFHRIDGLHQLWRGESGKNIDKKIHHFSNKFVNGIIYQSDWGRLKFKDSGLNINKKYKIIPNAPDNSFFFNKEESKLGEKINLITTCWSPGKLKGIKFYMYLDQNLDFTKYNYTYIGAIPEGYSFKNIKKYDPMWKKELGENLRNHDIFISGVQKDCASNCITEALTCGLPVLYYNDGGSPEIVNEGGIGFNNIEEIIPNLELIVKNYDSYVQNVKVPTIEETAKEYIDFFKSFN